MKISEKEVLKRKDEICNNCKHHFKYHIFWTAKKSSLELLNCNECFCNKFAKTGQGVKE